MKRRLLLAALLLVVAGFFWWLARHETPAPLAVRFLHQTNNSLGQVRYLIAVTNLSRQIVFGEFNGRCYLPPMTTPRGVVSEGFFSNFELGGGSRMVVAWERTGAQSGQAVLRYSVRSTLAGWKEWLHEKISPGTNPSRELGADSPTLIIDLPSENSSTLPP